MPGDKLLAILIRRPMQGDQGFVAATWVNSLWTVGGHKSDHNALVDRMLDDPAIRLRIACDPDRPEHILGWIAYTPAPAKALHYVYTRDKYRKQGTAKALMLSAFASFPRCYTMLGPDGKALAERYPLTIHMDVHEFLR